MTHGVKYVSRQLPGALSHFLAHYDTNSSNRIGR